MKSKLIELFPTTTTTTIIITVVIIIMNNNNNTSDTMADQIHFYLYVS